MTMSGHVAFAHRLARVAAHHRRGRRFEAAGTLGAAPRRRAGGNMSVAMLRTAVFLLVATSLAETGGSVLTGGVHRYADRLALTLRTEAPGWAAQLPVPGRLDRWIATLG